MTGLLALLDDIALLSDDVAAGAKTATIKTSGILGDDVAVNAEKATGFSQSRELIVIFKIFKESMINKTILLPIVFFLSFIYPPLLTILLVFGGLYLLFEGGEKVHHILTHKVDEEHINQLKKSTSENILDIESKKIKSAIFTDFILSLEIIVIAFNAIPEYTFTEQMIIVTVVAYVVTFLVYGIVAAIVRIDNTVFWLMEKGFNNCGLKLVSLQAKLLTFLTYVGTIAMFIVGGDIINHQFHIVTDNLFPVIAMGVILGTIIAYTVDFILKWKTPKKIK